MNSTANKGNDMTSNDIDTLEAISNFDINACRRIYRAARKMVAAMDAEFDAAEFDWTAKWFGTRTAAGCNVEAFQGITSFAVDAVKTASSTYNRHETTDTTDWSQMESTTFWTTENVDDALDALVASI